MWWTRPTTTSCVPNASLWSGIGCYGCTCATEPRISRNPSGCFAWRRNISLCQAFRSAPHLTYITAGLDASFIQVELDLVHTPFKADHFAVIICCHVLEHIGDDLAALRELRRVLMPGGLAFLQSPLRLSLGRATFEDATVVTPADRARVFGQRDHVRIYGRDYRDRLAAAGFAVTVDPYVKTLEPELISRYGLITEDHLYIGTK